jgi:hypothetical protein
VAQYWVHPGVIQSVLNDRRISVSGAGVAAASGAEIVGGDVSDLYLSSEAAAGIIDDYGLQPDPAGQLRYTCGALARVLSTCFVPASPFLSSWPLWTCSVRPIRGRVTGRALTSSRKWKACQFCVPGVAWVLTQGLW